MTERDKSNLIREKELKKIKQLYEADGAMIYRILSQNSPSSLLLFTEDDEQNERYVEIKFVVKKPEYEPDEDIEAFKAEIAHRAVKQVKANLNKLNKTDRALAEPKADEEVRKIIESYN
jgi:hypothetical protein